MTNYIATYQEYLRWVEGTPITPDCPADFISNIKKSTIRLVDLEVFKATIHEGVANITLENGQNDKFLVNIFTELWDCEFIFVASVMGINIAFQEIENVMISVPPPPVEWGPEYDFIPIWEGVER